MQVLRTLSKVVRHPDIALMRLALRYRLARAPIPEERARLFAFLSGHFGVDAAALLREYRESDFARWFRSRRTALEQPSGPLRLGTTDRFGLEALYLLVRAARPQVVVETGVLYGASSAHILAALDANGAGRLHSIDLPHDAGEPPHDFLVPERLRPRWALIVDDSRTELPPLLDELQAIDFFHHDSLHTFEHMMWEYEAALPHLRDSGVLSSDDVRRPHSVRRLFGKNAFPTFCERHGLEWTEFRNMGAAVRPQGRWDSVRDER